MKPLRSISYGGGVQSTALVVLATRGVIDFDYAVMANVGDDSENPDTLAYVRDVVAPYLETNGGPELVVLDRVMRRGPDKGKVRTLYGQLTDPDNTSDLIPVRLHNGAPASRSCTTTYKVRVINRWQRDMGATKENPATTAIGISTDEIFRANPDRRKVDAPYEQIVYPLLDLGIDRAGCAALISDEGLPVPPKSSCWFCPFHSRATWAELRRDRPDLFDRAAELEATINARRAELGKDEVWLTDRMRPLHEAIHEAQPALFSHDEWSEIDGQCDSGYCFT